MQAADGAAWAAFHALAASVHDELDRRDGDPADPAALAEIAHLQVRLDLLLRERLNGAAARLTALAASRAYQANART